MKVGPFEAGVVYQGDCIELMKQLPDFSIHMIAADPPYGAGNSHLREQNINEETEIHNDKLEDWEVLIPAFLDESARVLNAHSSAFVCFTDGGGPKIQFARFATWMAERLDFHCVSVWAKGMLGMGWKYRRDHEFIMVGNKKGSDLRWFDSTGSVPTVVRITRALVRDDPHPSPKPVELMEYLIRLHTQPGDVVLDPFAGGGPTGVACKKLGRHFIGFELEPRWVYYANRRIENTKEQYRLFGD